MKTETQTKTIYTIVEAWVNATYKELKNLYSGYAFERTDFLEDFKMFDNYDRAIEEFEKIQPKLEYDCYNKKCNLYEYYLVEELIDDDGEVIESTIIKSKEAIFVAIDENGEVVEKSEHLKDLIREYDLDYIKVVAK